MAGFNYSVNVYPFNGNGATKAFATVIVDNVFEVKGFKVVEGRNGTFVSMPQKKGKDKKTGEDRWYPDVVFHEPTDPDNKIYKGPVQEEIEKAIIAKYRQLTNQSSRATAADSHTSQPTPTNERPSSPFGDGPAW